MIALLFPFELIHSIVDGSYSEKSAAPAIEWGVDVRDLFERCKETWAKGTASGIPVVIYYSIDHNKRDRIAEQYRQKIHYYYDFSDHQFAFISHEEVPSFIRRFNIEQDQSLLVCTRNFTDQQVLHWGFQDFLRITEQNRLDIRRAIQLLDATYRPQELDRFHLSELIGLIYEAASSEFTARLLLYDLEIMLSGSTARNLLIMGLFRYMHNEMRPPLSRLSVDFNNRQLIWEDYDVDPLPLAPQRLAVYALFLCLGQGEIIAHLYNHVDQVSSIYMKINSGMLPAAVRSMFDALFGLGGGHVLPVIAAVNGLINNHLGPFKADSYVIKGTPGNLYGIHIAQEFPAMVNVRCK